MEKAPIVEEEQFSRMLQVASETGYSPIRDVAMLWVAYGTGCMLMEFVRLTVADYLNEDGSVREVSCFRAEIALGFRERPLYWSNPRVVAALDAYLEFRLRVGHGVIEGQTAYRGLDPDSPLFLGAQGQTNRLIMTNTVKGTISVTCDYLGTIFSHLHTQAGVKGGTFRSARRTFAVRLYRKGCDIHHIKDLLGLASLKVTKGLIGSEPVRFAQLVAEVV